MKYEIGKIVGKMEIIDIKKDGLLLKCSCNRDKPRFHSFSHVAYRFPRMCKMCIKEEFCSGLTKQRTIEHRKNTDAENKMIEEYLKKQQKNRKDSA